jgi:hypothetical protein
VGGRITFDFRPHAEPFDGVVVLCSPGERFAYTFGDVSIVDWRVEALPHGTRYTLTQHDVEASVADDDTYDAADLGAGWHGLLQQLDMYLASGQLVPDTGEAERRPVYEALLREG